MADKYLMEGANGALVWVPADRLESWQKAQAEIKAGTYKGGGQLKDALKARLLEAAGKAPQGSASPEEPKEKA